MFITGLTSIPLVKCNSFPIKEDVAKAFNDLKMEIEKSAICTFDESLPFIVETDIAFAEVLNQGGRPVAFFPGVFMVRKLNILLLLILYDLFVMLLVTLLSPVFILLVQNFTFVRLWNNNRLIEGETDLTVCILK